MSITINTRSIAEAMLAKLIFSATKTDGAQAIQAHAAEMVVTIQNHLEAVLETVVQRIHEELDGCVAEDAAREIARWGQWRSRN